MAVYIKKENLGSGRQPRPTNPRSLTRSIENMKTFQQLQASYAEAKAQAVASAREKYESNAEVQRWRTQMTKEERVRDAIERMVPTTRAVEEMRRGGTEVSYEDARKKAEEIAYKSERQEAKTESGDKE